MFTLDVNKEILMQHLKQIYIKGVTAVINVKYSYSLLFLTLSKYATLYFYCITNKGGQCKKDGIALQFSSFLSKSCFTLKEGKFYNK